VGGTATNAAIACACLGSKADLCTSVGKHILSDFILKDIAENHIRIIDPIATDSGKPVFESIITSQHNGDRTIISYHLINKLFVTSNLNFCSNYYSMIMFDGFYPDLNLSVAIKARSEKIITLLDGGSWKSGMDELLSYIDITICSNDFQVPDGPDHEHVFSSLRRNGIREVAITRGEKSMLCLHDNLLLEINIPKIKVVDTLGAGNVFHGAYCHFYNLGIDLITSLSEAGRIASQSCKYFGTREWMDDADIQEKFDQKIE